MKKQIALNIQVHNIEAVLKNFGVTPNVFQNLVDLINYKNLDKIVSFYDSAVKNDYVGMFKICNEITSMCPLDNHLFFQFFNHSQQVFKNLCTDILKISDDDERSQLIDFLKTAQGVGSFFEKNDRTGVFSYLLLGKFQPKEWFFNGIKRLDNTPGIKIDVGEKIFRLFFEYASEQLTGISTKPVMRDIETFIEEYLKPILKQDPETLSLDIYKKFFQEKQMQTSKFSFKQNKSRPVLKFTVNIQTLSGDFIEVPVYYSKVKRGLVLDKSNIEPIKLSHTKLNTIFRQEKPSYFEFIEAIIDLKKEDPKLLLTTLFCGSDGGGVKIGDSNGGGAACTDV